jgi:hypothetical protein
MPGTSHGTKEIEKYFIKKNKGISRHESCKNTNISKAYTFTLDKSFHNKVNQAKAIFTNYGNPELVGLDWIFSVVGKNSSSPLLDINQFCLKNKINCIFFSRTNIILFSPLKSSSIISLNNVYSHPEQNRLDSS